MPVNAAEKFITKVAANPIRLIKSDLTTLSGQKQATLDWRTSDFELGFSLPNHNWYESLDLFVSMYPQGSIAPSTPIMMSYNGGPSIPLNSQGAEFYAQISLDPARIRPSQNHIKFTYQIPTGQDCLTPGHGQWVLDMTKSKLVARARAKPQSMKIYQIEQMLNHPMTAPKRVAIIAKGTNKFALEALLAQGIAGQVTALPTFQFTKNNSDFTLLIGTHDQVRPHVNEKLWLDSTGALVFVDSGKTTKLVLTAKNEEQVYALAKAFAQYHLPKVNRTLVSLHELYAGKHFAKTPVLGGRKILLSELGETNFNRSWRPDPATIRFNIANANTSGGVLTLNIAAASDTNPASVLKARLNGQAIGYTYLDKKKKRVEFDIKPGLLQATNNALSLEPLFETGGDENICAAQQNKPVILVSGKSTLAFQDQESGAYDLNQFAANGFPFRGNGQNLALVLTARSAKDRQATLQFLGMATQKFGPLWANADYRDTLPASSQNQDRDILIIGPNAFTDPTLAAAAPSALKLALQGRSLQQSSTQLKSSHEQHASLNSAAVFRIAAANTRSRPKAISGGIAAIFASPYADGRSIGVITSDTPAQFRTAIKALSAEKHWNSLQGSVTRWNSNTILMAQTARPFTSSLKRSSSAIILRGAYPAPVIHNNETNVNTTPRLAFLSSFVAASKQKYHAVSQSIAKIDLQRSSKGWRNYWQRKLGANYSALLLLAGLFLFFLIVSASPKSARPR